MKTTDASRLTPRAGYQSPAASVFRTATLRPQEDRLLFLQRVAGNAAVSRFLARRTDAMTEPSGPVVRDGTGKTHVGQPQIVLQRSFLSWVVKMGAKKVSKGMLKNFINTQIKAKLKGLVNKDMVKRFAKEADDILDALEDPWWMTALSWIPIAGDALDLARVPAQIRRAVQRAEKLEERVKKVLRVQGMKAADLLPATLKRSPSYASELEHLTYGELLELSKTSEKAAAMKKLIENEHRLMGKL